MKEAINKQEWMIGNAEIDKLKMRKSREMQTDGQKAQYLGAAAIKFAGFCCCILFWIRYFCSLAGL